MKKIWDKGIKLKITIGFAFILIVLIGVQYGLNRSIANVVSSQEELLKSTQLLTEIESIKSSVCFFESRVKGYVLTGKDSLLDNNEKYLNTIVSKFSTLKQYSPNARQILSIDRLVDLLNEEIRFTDEVMFQFQIDKKKSIDLVKSEKSHQLMTNILREFDKIHDIEEEKYNQIIIKNQKNSKLVKQMDASAYIFASLLVVLCVWILFKDVNKREQLEKQLIIARKKAQDAALIKENFMANMSHEIRTPLNAILGFNNLLKKTTLSAEQKEYVESASVSGENLLAIVNDILDFSKIEAGMIKFENINFNLKNTINSAVSMFEQMATQKNVKLTLTTSNTLPQNVLGDPTRLTQVLINLISNALKFTNQGSVEVFVSETSIDTKNSNINITVKDTGIGISSEKISEMFERFTQAKTDTTRKYGGTGLGLAIVKKLIELQNGSIWVESKINEGSSFMFTIPYIVSNNKTEPDSVIIKKEKNITEIFKNKNILVVEDNPMNQRLASFMLKDLELNFDICGNGKFAIEKINQNNYYLILMDIQMPEMNGYETTQYIRQQLKLNLPIIAMTAHVLPEEKERCISYGMTDYISKPIIEDELKNMLLHYLK